jgi:predicted nuclease with TOPRIM domain
MSRAAGFRFVTPPGWPVPEPGWVPPAGWRPPASWPPAPPGWEFWVADVPVEERGVSGELPQEDPPEPVVDIVGASSPLQAELEDVREQIEQARRELVELNDAILLQQVGIYEYHHPLENAEQYKETLTALRQEVKDFVKQGTAILAADRFAYNNSLAQGRKMTADFSKLMLRAYNAEADNCVRSVRAGTVASAKQRLDRSVESIAKLGKMMEMRVAPEYHQLRLREIELTGDYQIKVQEEREAAREERERLREEKRAEAELQAERERLEKERDHYASALAKLEAQGKPEQADALRERLSAIAEAIAQNDYRIANIRAGYVYVISNIGAFGENVVKIGMTRRIEPKIRIIELGDASVPFPFDTHLLHFSEDAVTLENELHKMFADRRLNHMNSRREFFFITPQEIRAALAEKLGSILEFTETPEATQYFQSRSSWPESARSRADGATTSH